MKNINLRKLAIAVVMCVAITGIAYAYPSNQQPQKQIQKADPVEQQKRIDEVKRSLAELMLNGSAKTVREAGKQGRESRTLEETAEAQIITVEEMSASEGYWTNPEQLMKIKSFEDIPLGKRVQVQKYVRDYKKQTDEKLKQAEQRYNNANAASKNALAKVGLPPSKSYKLPADEAMIRINNAYKKQTNQDLSPEQYNTIRETYDNAREEKENVGEATEESDQASILVNKFINCTNCKKTSAQ